MKRDPVASGTFTGREVENTRAKGLNTLFVVGEVPLPLVMELVERDNIPHIYFCANQSYETIGPHKLLSMVRDAIDTTDCLVSIDFPAAHLDNVRKVFGHYFNSPRLIPIISLQLPHAKTLNPNTVIKLDDDVRGVTNSGVWVTPVFNLMKLDSFTSWEEYKNDSTLQQ